MSEIGVYAQVTPSLGLAIGYDSDNGITVSYFASISAGVSADLWFSANFDGDGFLGFQGEGAAGYAGIGTISGQPGPTGSSQINLSTGDIFV